MKSDITVKDELCREVWGAIKAKLACFFDQYNTSLNETQAVSAEYIGIRDMATADVIDTIDCITKKIIGG